MSKNLRKCKKTMETYCRTKQRKTKASIMTQMSKDDCFFDALHEIIDNIHDGKLIIPSTKSKNLKKYTEIMNKIYRAPKSKIIRRKLVKQSGGFLPILLPVLTTIIAEIISHAISKKSDTDST